MESNPDAVKTFTAKSGKKEKGFLAGAGIKVGGNIDTTDMKSAYEVNAEYAKRFPPKAKAEVKPEAKAEVKPEAKAEAKAEVKQLKNKTAINKAKAILESSVCFGTDEEKFMNNTFKEFDCDNNTVTLLSDEEYKAIDHQLRMQDHSPNPKGIMGWIRAEFSINTDKNNDGVFGITEKDVFDNNAMQFLYERLQEKGFKE